jgi:hypothetical protein
MSIRALLVALAEVVLTSLGMAQVRVAAPDSGSLVRVTVSDKGSTHRTTGILTTQDADSIALLVQLPARGDSEAQPPARLVAISRSAITGWELSAGRRPAPARVRGSAVVSAWRLEFSSPLPRRAAGRAGTVSTAPMEQDTIWLSCWARAHSVPDWEPLSGRRTVMRSGGR